MELELELPLGMDIEAVHAKIRSFFKNEEQALLVEARGVDAAGKPLLTETDKGRGGGLDGSDFRVFSSFENEFGPAFLEKSCHIIGMESRVQVGPSAQVILEICTVDVFIVQQCSNVGLAVISRPS